MKEIFTFRILLLNMIKELKFILSKISRNKNVKCLSSILNIRRKFDLGNILVLFIYYYITKVIGDDLCDFMASVELGLIL